MTARGRDRAGKNTSMLFYMQVCEGGVFDRRKIAIKVSAVASIIPSGEALRNSTDPKTIANSAVEA